MLIHVIAQNAMPNEREINSFIDNIFLNTRHTLALSIFGAMDVVNNRKNQDNIEIKVPDNGLAVSVIDEIKESRATYVVLLSTNILVSRYWDVNFIQNQKDDVHNSLLFGGMIISNYGILVDAGILYQDAKVTHRGNNMPLDPGAFSTSKDVDSLYEVAFFKREDMLSTGILDNVKDGKWDTMAGLVTRMCVLSRKIPRIVRYDRVIFIKDVHQVIYREQFREYEFKKDFEILRALRGHTCAVPLVQKMAKPKSEKKPMVVK